MNDAALVDSDVLIEVSRGGRAEIIGMWTALAESGAVIAISTVSVAELWHGVRDREVAGLERLLEGLHCLSLDAGIARVAGTLLRKYRPSHGVELADAIIAASALTNRLPLWTRNRRHYPMPDLKFLD